MKWVKFRIKTVTDAEDIIISTLYDLGLEGAQIEDKVPLTAMEKEQMFVDILPRFTIPSYKRTTCGIWNWEVSTKIFKSPIIINTFSCIRHIGTIYGIISCIIGIHGVFSLRRHGLFS